MHLPLLTLLSLLTLTTSTPTTTLNLRSSLLQTCSKSDLGKSCNAGFIQGVATTGICTSTIIDVETGAFACSVATTSTASAPVPSSSVYDELPTTNKGRRLKDLRRLVENGLVML
ncbi:hypothetical protein DID88_010099 [Monilinia fructigena]|uniref:Uncharacterized protein n=1 Tax=Monilinia fructigena TaxID=38457 RepID=A0A395INM6_9HELO|nr:hypothetical protein DID88_010099 [Monilinia fructigena]